jgi:hypothetical protein
LISIHSSKSPWVVRNPSFFKNLCISTAVTDQDFCRTVNVKGPPYILHLRPAHHSVTILTLQATTCGPASCAQGRCGWPGFSGRSLSILYHIVFKLVIVEYFQTRAPSPGRPHACPGSGIWKLVNYIVISRSYGLRDAEAERVTSALEDLYQEISFRTINAG